MEIDAPATGTLSRAGEDHVWQLRVPEPTDLRVAITEMVGDFRFYVYRPGDTWPLHPWVDDGGSQTLELADAPAGLYQIIVYSPGYQTSTHPYHLVVGHMATPPLDSALFVVDDFDDPAAGLTEGTPRPEPAATTVSGPFDGVWGARTSTGSSINLTVGGGMLTTLTIDYGIRADACTLSGTRTLRFDPPVPVTNVPFAVEQSVATTLRFTPRPGSTDAIYEVEEATTPFTPRPGSTDAPYEVAATLTFRVEGRFTSLTAGNGTFVFSVFAPHLQTPCQGSERGVWTTSRGAP